ncbi:MAG: general secretion pathway protein D [Desulfobacteraceae bacterium Eth-SRB2]|nr:MAG: general secretion pathway protein D [Desulfobacteraceae bacterium Eth-SRB2]
MKPIIPVKLLNYVVWLGIIIHVTGCAGQIPRTHEVKGATTPVPSMKTVPETQPDLILDDGKQYRMVRTPFGIIKQRVVPPGIQKPSPLPIAKKEVSLTSTQPFDKTMAEPVPKKSSPLPVAKEKASLKSTQPIDKTITAPSSKLQKPGDEPPKKEPSEKGQIVLNFDDANLYEVIRTLAELLNINYIVDPNVRGKVTIHTAGALRKSDLFPVFFQILEANGLTALKEGSLYKITGLKDAPRLPILSRHGRKGEGLPPGQRVIMQIIPLKHISAAEITKLLTPFVSSQGTIISHDPSNTLLIVDKGINILKVLRLVDVFDIDLFEKVTHQFYTLNYMDAEEMVTLLNDILSSYDQAERADMKLIAINRLNMLLAVSQNLRLFKKIEEFIKTLDIPSEMTQPKIYVYSVKNGKADELTDLLNQIFSKDSGSDKRSGADTSKTDEKTKPKASSNPFAMKPVKSKGNKKGATYEAGEATGSGTLKEEIKVTADAIRNALVIEAVPSDYRIIENILNRLDVLPRQVLIEVIIAEISLDESTELGVEWSYLKGSGDLSTSLLSASMGSSGLQYLIGQTDRWTHALSTLASENKVNILSSPSVLASDNIEARINISTEVPVVSSTYALTESDLVSTNIQYRSTGVILTVTPHINENGLVSMEISQEVSEQSENVQAGGESYPSFFERSVNTSLTVKHNQTIVMGGLIKENKSDGRTGVPILNRIPILGFLFGKKSASISKAELIILITPRVITSLEDVDAVTEEFKKKVQQTINSVNAKIF